MRASHTILPIVFLLIATPFVSVHAAAQFPDSKRLLPPPPQVRPDVSHSVNRADASVVYEDTTQVQPATTSDGLASNAPQAESGAMPIVIAATVAAIAVVGLTLLWRSMRE